ncbi:CHAT domain-containing protein [Streptomyces sp. V4I8]|uniref:CHAT domain-containing protein n=1 Tax=Streptomyces sp. V4I8 TaxID=3156469 RepID=UPI0035112F43
MDLGSGGTRRLRAWARDAVKRADLLIPFHQVPPRVPRGVVVDQAFFDRTLDELTQLERLLESDGQRRTPVVARLGVLLALRHMNGGPAEDRGRALVHLRHVREAEPQAPNWERQCVALCLLLLMAPPPQLGGGIGLAPDFPAALNWYLTQIGRDGMAEVPALLSDVQDLPMPPQLRAEIQKLDPVMPVLEELLRTGGVSDTMQQRLKDALPEDFPYEGQLGGLAHSMGLRNAPGMPSSPPHRAAGRDDPPREPAAGGSVRQVAGEVDAETSAALLAAAAAIGTGDPTLLDTAVRQMAEVAGRLPPGHPMTLTMKAVRAVLLHGAGSITGSGQDDDFAHRVTEEMKAGLGLEEAAPASGADADARHAIRILSVLSRISRAERAEDLGRLDEVLDELRGLHATVPREQASWILVPLALSQAYQARGSLLEDESEILRGLAHLEECARSAPPPWDEMLGELNRQAKLLRGHYESDPALVEESLYGAGRVTPALPMKRQLEEQRTALALMERYEYTDDPADLNRAIASLERIRERARQGQETAFAADALWHLVRAYWLRWFRTQNPEEVHAATNAGLDALHAVSADVLLQVGSEHGLQTARSAADRALMTALEALGYRRHDSRMTLFATPSMAELRAGVAAGDADVLVYLLPGQGEAHGMAIALGPDMEPEVLDLPSLLATPSGPLAEYLNAAVARSRVGGEVSERRWERALGRLCDWASYAVMAPLTEQLEDRLAAYAGRNTARTTARRGPLRLVLVPCGNLGVVPWHAARHRERGDYRYACQDLVVTYAASGSQFLAAVGRDRLPVDAAPVLVADPRMDLTHAEREISALHRAFYPRARLYGEFYEAPVPPQAPGTPDELLAVLGQASLLHVASHGSAGPRPTVSALSLAFPGDSEVWPAERGGPGAVPDLGMLTVTRLLDVTEDSAEGAAAAVGPAASARRRAGPLVVLSACETDLSTRDHDEALTLTTAFVARGARNVVGSRWTTVDSASALMMAVFHHFVAVEGQAPANALRSAQLWMLDPQREVPGSVGDALARDAQLPGLDRLSVWAAFIHQGHPGQPGLSATAAAMEGAT